MDNSGNWRYHCNKSWRGLSAKIIGHKGPVHLSSVKDRKRERGDLGGRVLIQGQRTGMSQTHDEPNWERLDKECRGGGGVKPVFAELNNLDKSGVLSIPRL
ncbi:hypothetical protein J6590_031712 [Homalodisca vitripennis]|nr:hypothetical protein J6590_031712 [Homalodisca vitripennis]